MDIFDKALQKIAAERSARNQAKHPKHPWLKSEVRKEQKEHPWLSKKQAQQVVIDHRRRGSHG